MSIKFITSNGEEIPVSGGEGSGIMMNGIILFDGDIIPDEFEEVFLNIGGGAPIGSGMDYFGSTAPDDYLFADGSAISRTEYSELFKVIGTTYGAGDGSTTFNLPDKRQRVTIMKNDSDTLGQVKGENKHILTKEEIPNYTLYSAAHTHIQNSHTHTQAAHAHNTINKDDGGSNDVNHNYLARNYNDWSTNSGPNKMATSSATPTINGTTATNQNTTITVTSGGSGTAMNNMQESLVCNYIIKVK